MIAFKNPVRSLAVPHQRVAGQLHVVLHTELHKRIRCRPVVAFFAGPGMKASPVHLVLGYHLIELRFHKRNIGDYLLCAAAKALPRGHRAIDRRADFEVLLVSVFERD